MTYLIAIIVAAMDQWIKWQVASYLMPTGAIPIWRGVLEILYLRNQGAAFSILLNQRAFLIGVAFAVIAAVVYVDRRFAAGKRSLQIALGMLLGGAVGNLIDRIWHGYVIDYVYVEAIHYPVFNLADSAIVLAVLYLIFRAWRGGELGNRRERARKRVKEDLHDAQ